MRQSPRSAFVEPSHSRCRAAFAVAWRRCRAPRCRAAFVALSRPRGAAPGSCSSAPTRCATAGDSLSARHAPAQHSRRRACSQEGAHYHHERQSTIIHRDSVYKIEHGDA